MVGEIVWDCLFYYIDFFYGLLYNYSIKLKGDLRK